MRSFFDVTRTGELLNRLAQDTTVLKDAGALARCGPGLRTSVLSAHVRACAVTVNVSMGLRWSVTILGGIIYLFVTSWKVAPRGMKPPFTEQPPAARAARS